jgi:hypothetical protein
LLLHFGKFHSFGYFVSTSAKARTAAQSCRLEIVKGGVKPITLAVLALGQKNVAAPQHLFDRAQGQSRGG